MAQDFEISVQREGEDVHLKLKGDFGGTSAHELLNALGTSCAPCSQVYIHTGSLKTLDQFGVLFDLTISTIPPATQPETPALVT